MGLQLFITGRLAKRALERILGEIGIEYRVLALDRAVAALLDADYIAEQVVPLDLSEVERVVIPGLCNGETLLLERVTGLPAIKGPEDLKDLASFLGMSRPQIPAPEPTARILAEIVGAPALSIPEMLRIASYYRESGADIIDLGAEVSEPFPHVREAVTALKDAGYTVSIDTLRPEDLLAASEAGVDLILSVNSSNMFIAPRIHCPQVVIPDEDGSLDSLYRNVEVLAGLGKSYIVDPVMRPLTMDFARCVHYYWEARQRFPNAPMLMGVANVTELADADSVGMNAVLAAMAAELNVDYLLTTEKSYRARGAILELDHARRLMNEAIYQGTLPKHIDDSLLVVKEPERNPYSEEELREMQGLLCDKNFRIFVTEDSICVFNSEVFLTGTTADSFSKSLGVPDPGHAFYLGKELARAETALNLGKKYVQDSPMRWGYMTRDHRDHRGNGR
jgi:dihydropteroate synthase-like protein